MQAVGDTFEVRMAKTDSLFEGQELVEQALGVGSDGPIPLGELMARNDYDRNKTASTYVSLILDALRFTHTKQDEFLAFVEGLRAKAEQAETVNRNMATTLKDYLPRN